MAGSISESFATSTVTATETLQKTLFPSQTASPVVYFTLSTTVPIYDVPTPLTTPFNPNYELFRDGSLITPLFIDDFVTDKMRLILMGVFGMLFSRNLFIAIDYTIRVKIKHKTLFYFLIASQFCALPTIAALFAPFFLQSARCDISTLVAAIFVNLSFSFLIPGIFGIKVFRFLGGPQIVPIFLSVVHVSSLVLFFSDLPNLVSTRKLTGSCTTQGNIPRMIIGIGLLVSEILFICACFAYAVWRAKRYPEAQGRTSIRFSLDPGNTGPDQIWNYLTMQQDKNANGRESRQLSNRRPSPLMRLIMVLFGDRDLINEPSYVPRKPSTPGAEPILLSRKRRRSWRDFPRMFRIPDALKNELAYTAAISVTCAFSSTLVVVGLFYERWLGGPLAWVGISWSITSLLILHNFSRLVRRNERDRIFQEPLAWNPISGQPSMTQLKRPTPSRPSGISTSFVQTPPLPSQFSTLNRPPSHHDQGHVNILPEDPFADFELVRTNGQRNETKSWTSQEKLIGGALAYKPSNHPS